MAASILTSFLAVAVSAQTPPPASAPHRPMPALIVLHQLDSTLYWASGGVGNVGVIIGKTGVIVVDATVAVASARDLLARIGAITSKPVTTVILTHGDIDHVGGLSAFPDKVTVVAQARLRQRIVEQIASGRSAVSANRIPTRVVDAKDSVTIDGVALQLLHWAPAHTASDLVIFLPEHRIVFTGDIFAMDQPRALIHREQGGTSQGWLTSAKEIVALDADRFVVGHGEVHDKAKLRQRIALVETERRQIVHLVSRGKSLPEIEATVGDPPPDASFTTDGPRFVPFAQVVYQELREGH